MQTIPSGVKVLFFLPVWFIIGALPVALGSVPEVVTSNENERWWWILSIVIMLLVQSLLIPKILHRRLWWLPLTLLGIVIGIVVALIFDAYLNQFGWRQRVYEIALSWFFIGLGIGVAQSFVLDHLLQRILWSGTQAVSWPLVMVVRDEMVWSDMLAADRPYETHRVFIALVEGSMLGGIYSLITGVALLLLFSRPYLSRSVEHSA